MLSFGKKFGLKAAEDTVANMKDNGVEPTRETLVTVGAVLKALGLENTAVTEAERELKRQEEKAENKFHNANFARAHAARLIDIMNEFMTQEIERITAKYEAKIAAVENEGRSDSDRYTTEGNMAQGRARQLGKLLQLLK